MDRKTKGFVDVTEAAERLVESLSEFRDRAGRYVAAEGRLAEAQAASQELARATEQMAVETGNAIRLLNDLGIPKMREDLTAVAQTATGVQAQLLVQNEKLGSQGKQLSRAEVVLGEHTARMDQMDGQLQDQQTLLLSIVTRLKVVIGGVVFIALLVLVTVVVALR